MFPAHVGIIMDGNGRWAVSRGQARTEGHLEGLAAGKRIVKAASDMGLRYLTLYVFSTENWKRTADEVGFIMGLVRRYLKAEFDFARDNHIRVRHAGDISGLPADVATDIRDVCEDTRDYEGMQVIMALNYGGRDEIVRAVNRIVAANQGPVTEEMIRRNLDNPDIPDPDLIIRTAGEFRVSNFLLWEGAYAEYAISDKFWPDWTESDLRAAVQSYERRERRFGGVKA
jgi:undecaprenyl diphosphate synthase